MPGQEKPVRVWCDGCYDIMHFGHANQLRQAKAMGDYLIVGVHNDSDVQHHKGPTVLTEEERYKMVRSVKWVDEVVEASPYVTELETLNEHQAEFCVHGDDITLDSNGQDTYRIMKEANRYRECKRTQGVSTTDLVGRMLLMTRSPSISEPSSDLPTQEQFVSPYTKACNLLQTSNKITQFSNRESEPKPGDKIVYTAGAFDMMHPGLVDFLSVAKKQGDYLIVGLYDDTIVNGYKGHSYPIQSIHERVLSVLANRDVNEVVIGAPYPLTEEVIDHFNINLVVRGMLHDSEGHKGDPYSVAKDKGIYKEIDSGNDLTGEGLVFRIIKNRSNYIKRNKDKQKKECNLIKMQAEIESKKAANANGSS